MIKIGILGAALLLAPSVAQAAGFTNGGFENGNANGWVGAGISRTSILNNNLGPEDFTPGVGNTRSAVVTLGDPSPFAAFGSTVYNGNHSYRVEDTQTGGLASLLQQRVNNYTDANIFFAWKAALSEAHGANDAATMIITLTDITTGLVLINRIYNAAAVAGVPDPRFTYDNATGYFYTADWQVEQLATGAAFGHDLLLSIMAADCQPTAHEGFVYIDGFGAVAPPPGAVPEPATWAMMLIGFGAVGGTMRYRRRKTAVSFG